jgi:hypothetical protein
MPKQKKKHNRTKRIYKPKYNSNTNAESINIGKAPGINTVSVQGLNNNRNIENFRPNRNNNINLQNSNFYENVNNFPINENSDYDVIYVSVPKISSEDLYKLYSQIKNTPILQNINNNNNDFDSIQRLKYVFHHPEETDSLNEFWYSVFLRLQDLMEIKRKGDEGFQTTLPSQYMDAFTEQWEWDDGGPPFTLDISNMNLIEIAYPLDEYKGAMYVGGIGSLNAENNRIEKIPRLPRMFGFINFDNNPLIEPYLSIYKKYRDETGDVEQFIHEVNQEHTSEILEKINKPKLPTNLTRHIAKFVEGGKRKTRGKKRAVF